MNEFERIVALWAGVAKLSMTLITDENRVEIVADNVHIRDFVLAAPVLTVSVFAFGGDIAEHIRGESIN